MAGGSRIYGRPAGGFLEGDKGWWTPPVAPLWSKARWKETSAEYSGRQKIIISALEEREIKAPSSCRGWKRQRLRPLAISWLFPAAMAIGCAMLAGLILILDEADDILALLSAQLGMLLSAGGLLLLQWRRIGSFHGFTLTSVSAFSLIGTGYVGWSTMQGEVVESSVVAWTILLLVSLMFVLRGGSAAVSFDGARWLMPITPGTTIRVDGEEREWKEGRISIERVDDETVTLRVERIAGACFLVLSNSSNFNIRKDPLLRTASKVVVKRAIALMQANAGKAVEWPNWALPLSGEEE